MDSSVIEVFINNGIIAMSRRVYPSLNSSTNIALYAGNNKNCLFKNIQLWQIKNTIFTWLFLCFIFHCESVICQT